MKFNTPLLQRLIDEQPYNHRESKVMNVIEQRQLIADIKLNIENILNTRSLGIQLPEELIALKNSILNYGMIDFSHSHFGHKSSQTMLCQHIKENILHSEKRLSDVYIEILTSDIAVNRTIKLKIYAKLNSSMINTAATFDSSWDYFRQKFTIDG